MCQTGQFSHLEAGGLGNLSEQILEPSNLPYGVLGRFFTF